MAATAVSPLAASRVRRTTLVESMRLLNGMTRHNASNQTARVSLKEIVAEGKTLLRQREIDPRTCGDLRLLSAVRPLLPRATR